MVKNAKLRTTNWGQWMTAYRAEPLCMCGSVCLRVVFGLSTCRIFTHFSSISICKQLDLCCKEEEKSGGQNMARNKTTCHVLCYTGARCRIQSSIWCRLAAFFLFHTFSYACVYNCSSAIVSAVTAMFWPAHRAQRVRFETLADCCSCESILFRCHCIWPPLLWIMQESPGF